MEKLKAPEISKPEFVSEVTLRTRPEMKVVSLSGKGDSMKTFDGKTEKLLVWLKSIGRQGFDDFGIMKTPRRKYQYNKI